MVLQNVCPKFISKKFNLVNAVFWYNPTPIEMLTKQSNKCTCWQCHQKSSPHKCLWDLLDHTNDSLEGISLRGGYIFCTQFWVESESGLKIELGGRISELHLILYWGYFSQLNLGSKINPLVFEAIDTKIWTVFLPVSMSSIQMICILSFKVLSRHNNFHHF